MIIYLPAVNLIGLTFYKVYSYYFYNDLGIVNSNLVKTKTITDTTNSGGGIFAGLSANEYIILGAVCDNNNTHRNIVNVLNHNWLIIRDYETFNLVTDREVTITYCYIKR